ncbi:AMP dependent synthetase and ligase [Histoplasma capsulatum var. duboisii H88]|uniref:AMP dependent synthetase and ligase n=1 Tax=Ajellomyces capsulatus (strain H88) TaxID=544711 RepID=F0URX9_AJEC8|nr:AMP dependent synthetase and ligase [Histoplasma capsulatum var. duboisii H88]
MRFERTDFFPPHTGDNILPLSPFFSRFFAILFPIEEAVFSTTGSRCVAILSSSSGKTLAQQLSAHIKKCTGKEICCVDIARHFLVPVLSFVAALRYGLVTGTLEEGQTAYLFWCTNYLYESDVQPHETDQYLVGTRQFRALLCATSALPTSGQEFWTKILDGKTILSRYGATEIGPVFTPSIDSDSVPPGSVGPVLTITLSKGHQGEVLIKGPCLFDEVATSKARDADGDDLSVLADDEFSQRVAAVVGLKIEQTTYKCPGNGWVGKYFTLDDLRADRRTKLAGYKIPTLLRVVVHEILKTSIGKVVKGVLGPKFFPVDYEQHPDVQIWSPVKRSVPDPRL